MEQPAIRIPLPKSRLVFAIAGVILALLLAGPALAEYLGPDRVTTEFQEVRDPDNDVWTLTHVDPNDGFLDVCLIIHTCDEHPSVQRQQALCGWTADNSGCDRAYKIEEVTVVLPEATISSDLQGCTPVDGWCTDSPTLRLAGTEPVAGETITLIEGTRNGEPFACPGAACDVPLVQGGNQFTFWALSTWGDSSQMGTLSAQVDSKGPTVKIPDSWYIWEPLAIQVEDAQHGIDKVTLSIDGGEYGDRSYSWAGSVVPDDFIWDRHFGEIIAPIGEYPVTVKARDGLGNISTALGEIVIPDPGADGEGEAAASPSTVEGESLTISEEQLDPFPLPSNGIGTFDGGTGADASAAESSSAGEGELAATHVDSSTEFTPRKEGASPPNASKPASVPAAGIHWGQAALGLAGVAVGYGSLRRASRQAGRTVSYEARTSTGLTLEPGRETAFGVDSEPDAVGGFLEWLKTRAEGASGIVDTVIGLTRDTDTAPSAFTALWRLLRPETSPNPTYTQILMNELLEAAKRGDFLGRTDDLLREAENLAPIRRPLASLNYTDLKQFVSGLGRGEVASGVGDLVSVALILAAERAMARDPALGTFLKRLGGSLGATSDLMAGGRLLVNEAKFAEFFELAGTRLGALSSFFGLGVGSIQWFSGVERLQSDPSISSMKSNERWGVFSQALGGGLLAVGSAAGLAVALVAGTGAIAASLTVLVPVGLVLMGAGFLIENWDWIGSGVSAWFGARHNAWTIVKALPDYVTETVVKPIAREVDATVIKPVQAGLRAWEGVRDNGRKIIEALPGYLDATVVQPAAQLVNERLIEPVRNGLQAWSGIVENGQRIIRALPDYVSETIVKPTVQAIQDSITRPVSRTVNTRIVEPARDFIQRRIIQPTNTLRTNVVEPVRNLIQSKVVQPVSNAISNGISALRGLFGGH
jgi:hypothetical protein